LFLLADDTIPYLEALLAKKTNQQHIKNIKAALEAARSGTKFNFETVFADRKMMSFVDWRPEMGSFFTQTLYVHL
jgi:hypothetical protein